MPAPDGEGDPSAGDCPPAEGERDDAPELAGVGEAAAICGADDEGGSVAARSNAMTPARNASASARASRWDIRRGKTY